MSSREELIRTPVQGARQKVRNALRDAGFQGRFRVEHRRRSDVEGGPYFLIQAKDGQTSIPITSFDGAAVVLQMVGVRRG